MNDRELVRDDEVFVRMNLAERVQHYLLIFTFVTLGSWLRRRSRAKYTFPVRSQ
jgi:hypothetical protein